MKRGLSASPAESKSALTRTAGNRSFEPWPPSHKEIRWLGKDRICEFHLKDNPRYLGKGSIDFVKVIEAIVEIGFSGWAQLETVAPSNNVKADMTTNLAFIRELAAKH